MFYPKIYEQTILEILQGDSISATADSFLIDRQATFSRLEKNIIQVVSMEPTGLYACSSNGL